MTILVSQILKLFKIIYFILLFIWSQLSVYFLFFCYFRIMPYYMVLFFELHCNSCIKLLQIFSFFSAC